MSLFRQVLSQDYLTDISTQAAGLGDLLEAGPAASLGDVHVDQFDRIILTGMGASHYATYPAWQELVRSGISAWWLPTDELLQSGYGLLDEMTLVVMTSQSGRTAESIELLERLAAEPGARSSTLAITNDPNSPLAEGAEWVVLLHAGHEHAVSTRSYVNSVVASGLAVDGLLHRSPRTDEYVRTRESMDAYLRVDDLEAALDRTMGTIGLPRKLLIVGRGSALSSALTGSLIIKEAAKFQSEALSSSEFRHGPFELADPDLCLVIVEGPEALLAHDYRLADDVTRCGAAVVWVGPNNPRHIRALPTPAYVGAGKDVAQILPLQLVSVVLAVQTGQEPGVFRNGQKITTAL